MNYMQDKDLPKCMQCGGLWSFRFVADGFGDDEAKSLEMDCRRRVVSRHAGKFDTLDIAILRAQISDIAVQREKLNARRSELVAELNRIEREVEGLDKQSEYLDKCREVIYAVEEPAPIADGVRPCPSCRAPIERAEGCPQMFCVVCRTKFNWDTGRIIGEGEGYSNGHHNEYTAAVRERIECGEFKFEDFLEIMRRVNVLKRIRDYCIELYGEAVDSARARINFEQLRRDCIDGKVDDFELTLWHATVQVQMKHARSRIFMAFLKDMFDAFVHYTQCFGISDKRAARERIVQTHRAGIKLANRRQDEEVYHMYHTDGESSPHMAEYLDVSEYIHTTGYRNSGEPIMR